MNFFGEMKNRNVFKVGIVYLVVPISGLLITFYAVFFILEHLRVLREAPPEQG